MPDRLLQASRGVDRSYDCLRRELIAGIGRVESKRGTSSGETVNVDAGEIRLNMAPPGACLVLVVGSWRRALSSR